MSRPRYERVPQTTEDTADRVARSTIELRPRGPRRPGSGRPGLLLRGLGRRRGAALGGLLQRQAARVALGPLLFLRPPRTAAVVSHDVRLPCRRSLSSAAAGP